MERFINDKLRMLFICKDDKSMGKLASGIVIELIRLSASSEDTDLKVETYEELMLNCGRLSQVTNKERLNKTATITVETWFGIYKLYSYENGFSPLLGTRPNVLVLDDDLEFDKDVFKDCIEPLASEYGDMILLSKFNQCESKTKYTRQLHHHVKEIHANLVYNTVVKGE